MRVQNNYNPDVLSCLANLSSDEVFTPPKLANEILDLFPKQVWKNKNTTFLDPVSKSGVFLREIAKRLLEGLQDEIPNLQKRIDHIYTKQIFGIGITELTSLLSRRSLYCSKEANGKYSVLTSFNDNQGNIFFDSTKHDWKNGRCSYCGASQSEYERELGLETHAYQFIHNNLSGKIRNMKFDVIIGNPPYQLSDSGFGRSAKPLYNAFVHKAKKMQPRFLTMIIPARWYAGGKGLDDFRSEMLNDKRIRKLVDFENSSEVFPGVDIAGGICYFLWDRDNRGLCEVINVSGDKRIINIRELNEFDTFIRHSKAIPIIKKVINKNSKGKTLSQLISSRKPFGLQTNYAPKSSGVPCWFTQRIGLRHADLSDITDSGNLLNKWKLLIPPAPIAGQTDFTKPVGFYYNSNTVIAKPGECCTESWLVAGAFTTKSEAEAFRSYLFTKIVRFLLLQTVVSQHVTKEKFIFVPDLGKYEGKYTDKQLGIKWGITNEEWEFVNSRIK
jgi:site-specific DNA-methyltransferase (adenine-specific)